MSASHQALPNVPMVGRTCESGQAVLLSPGGPGRIRTRDPLLERHIWAVARRALWTRASTGPLHMLPERTDTEPSLVPWLLQTTLSSKVIQRSVGKGQIGSVATSLGPGISAGRTPSRRSARRSPTRWSLEYGRDGCVGRSRKVLPTT
jgi:hypothetical protein